MHFPTSKGQAGATSGAAASENLAAVGSRHSLAETMNLGSMQLLGLVSTLRHFELHLLKDFSGGKMHFPALTRRRARAVRRSPRS